MKKPYLAFCYSFLIPGLGQLFLGDYAKGWTLICMDAGIVVGFLVNHGYIARFFIILIYLAIMIPAALDAFQNASGRPRAFGGDSVAYVIVMLLTVGPFAVPLLWQSSKFSKGAKIGWTVFVILCAFLTMVVMSLLASFFDAFMKQNFAGMIY